MFDTCGSVIGERTFPMIDCLKQQSGARAPCAEGWSWCAASGLLEHRNLLRLRLGEPGNVGQHVG
jgi:hypothetical protein